MDFFPESSGFSRVFPWIFGAAFAVIAGIIIRHAVRGIGQWNRNNHSPTLTVAAKIVGKRQNTWGGSGDFMAHTDYYATFQLEDGQRMELQVPSGEIGLMAEGDAGTLTYQGTRFLSFQRG